MNSSDVNDFNLVFEVHVN